MQLADGDHPTANDAPLQPLSGYRGTILNVILSKNMAFSRSLRVLEREHLQAALDEHGNTALHKAAAFGWTEGIDALLKWANNDTSQSSRIHASSSPPEPIVDLNRQNLQGSTALHLAAIGGHWESLECLLEHGASRFLQDDTGCTVLHVVVKQLGSAMDATFSSRILKVTKLLLKLDQVDCINLLATRDNLGQTPLHNACQFDAKPIVKELCSHEADVDAPGHAGMRPLHVAAQWGRSETVEVLFDFKAQPNLRDGFGWSELHWLSYQCGSEHTARILLEHGSRVDLQNNAGSTALHIASEKGFEALVVLLLQYGASAGVRDHQKMQPFQYTFNNRIRDILMSPLGSHNDRFEALWEAVESGSESGIDEAIGNINAGIDAQDHRGDTVLHRAISCGDYSVVAKILSKGADPNLSNKKGQTALHLAAVVSDKRTIELLCSHCAEAVVKDENGETPINLAVELQRWEAVHALSYWIVKSGTCKLVELTTEGMPNTSR